MPATQGKESSQQTERDVLGKRKKTARSRRTLVFSVTTLDFFMLLLLNFALQNSRSGRLVKTGSLQDVCRIHPVVGTPAHNMFLEIGPKLKLVDGYLH